MEVSLDWKVGDRFRLPGNSCLPKVYVLESFGPEKGYAEIRYWFVSNSSRFHAAAKNMQKLTPLEELL